MKAIIDINEIFKVEKCPLVININSLATGPFINFRR